MLILEARHWEVAHRSGSGTSQLGKWPWRVEWSIGLRRTGEWSVGVSGLLCAAFTSCVRFGLGFLDVSFALELRNELLDDIDLEFAEHI